MNVESVTQETEVRDCKYIQQSTVTQNKLTKGNDALAKRDGCWWRCVERGQGHQVEWRKCQAVRAVLSTMLPCALLTLTRLCRSTLSSKQYIYTVEGETPAYGLLAVSPSMNLRSVPGDARICRVREAPKQPRPLNPASDRNLDSLAKAPSLPRSHFLSDSIGILPPTAPQPSVVLLYIIS